MIDLEKLRKCLDEDLANPDGYWNKLKRKDEIKASRFPKVEAYIQKHGMPSVIERMISEHDDKWSDKCQKRGYETYPNNKFGILWDWIEKTYEPIHNHMIPQDFLNASYFVKGYWFTVYCGQGCFYRVYDSKYKIILQI